MKETAVPEQSLDESTRRETLRLLAPGTALRDGLERILRGNTGALVILGTDRATESMLSGGFPMDVPFSATRLRELAKMDGAIVVDEDVTTILSANVQLLPDPTIATDETGTRHRTADRVSKQTGFPVISVSKSMNIIAMYQNGVRHVIESSSEILARANQAVATLERYKLRLDEVQRNLSALEIEDLVTIRDVASVAQRTQMVLRIASEIEDYVIELGTDGRLISLQLEELMAGVAADRGLMLRDYTPTKIGRKNRTAEQAAADLDQLDSTALLDLVNVAAAIGFPAAADLLEQPISSRGYGLLSRVPRIPEAISERIIAHFKSLKDLLAASTDDLQAVEGVGDMRARSIRDGLSRIA
ncbi:MAG: integrity scanning protein DisA, partial [Actinomycetota bacterium]